MLGNKYKHKARLKWEKPLGDWLSWLLWNFWRWLCLFLSRTGYTKSPKLKGGWRSQLRQSPQESLAACWFEERCALCVVDHLHSASLKFLNCRLHKLRQWKLCKVHILRPLWWPATHRSGCPNHSRSRHCCIYHFPQNPSTWTHPPYSHAMSDWLCSLLQELHLPQCTWVKLLG